MFSKFEEPRKFSVLESQILYDPNNSYKNELVKINQFAKEDLENNLNGSLGYIHYLISDYKKDRWYRRDAFIQLHENLNTAIRAGIRALFYLNGFYMLKTADFPIIYNVLLLFKTGLNLF